MRQIPVPECDNKRVVVIGGGFAGLEVIKNLVGKEYQVILLDRHNYHTFQPLLYQVATAGLEPDSIAGPLRKQIDPGKDFYFRMARVRKILHEKKQVETDIGNIDYDYLVIATGSESNFFGNDTIQKNAFPLKVIPDALDLRSHILQNFEQAVITESQKELEKRMNVVIVGAGPTGVEVAGALGELKKHILPKDYPELDLGKMQIYLIEGMDRVLNAMSEKSSERALKALEKFGVKTMLNRMVKSFDGDKVVLDNEKEIPTRTVIWAAGVKGCILKGIPDEVVEKSRIRVDRYNRIKGFKDLFAIGDIASMSTEKFPEGHPMLAPVAIQQGKHLAKNLKRLAKGKDIKEFEYIEKGTMATVGRNRAVVDITSKLRFGGFLAWLIWMFVHLLQIIGIRNKIIIFSNWVWNYFTYDKGTRLIIRPFKPNWESEKEKEQDEERFIPEI